MAIISSILPTGNWNLEMLSDLAKVTLLGGRRGRIDIQAAWPQRCPIFPNCRWRMFGVWVEWTESLGHSWSHGAICKGGEKFLEIQSMCFNYLSLRTQISTSCQQSNSQKTVMEEGKKQMPVSLGSVLPRHELLQAFPKDWLAPWVVTHKTSNVELRHTQCWDPQMMNQLPGIVWQSSLRYLQDQFLFFLAKFYLSSFFQEAGIKISGFDLPPKGIAGTLEH